MVINGFEGAIIGVARRYGQPDLIAYDIEKIIEILINRDNMRHEEAIEYFEYNIVGAWIGETTPCFIDREKHNNVKQ
tara:strand:- start:116 stop:346 length:231 start_codon:yes stop_codon:yes gene_type:complete